MNCNYQFADVVGTVYKNANVQFLADGNTVLSPVGNKLKQFNLRENLSSTLPTESNFNIRHVALHPAGTHAFVVNEVGYCLYVSIVNRIILHRVKMGNDVPCAAFAPNGKKLAICVGGQVKIYSTVFCTAGQFNPFIYLCRRKLSNENITTVRWSRDGRLLVCGSEDKQVRVFSSDRQFANMSLFAMSQRAPIVDCFFVGEGYDVVSVDKRGMAMFWESTFQPKDLVLSPEHKLDETLEKMSYSKAKRCQMLEHCGSGMSVDVTAVALNEPANIIVCGFSNGVFVICELPEFNLIQNMRVGEIPVTTLNLSPAGDWLAIGCGHGSEAQLLVWEWQSETYVLKQQSHSQNIVSAAYSPDGLHLATGAEDGKVKIWNCQTSFCIVTFAEHNAAVSCVAWTQNGKVILSSSLEGTVRAHDMKRYRNFRTMACPKQTQLGRLCTDQSGELVMAAAIDDFQIYVWSMETGNLLDVLSGHSSVVSAISCRNVTLASVSLDKTMRVWNVVEASGAEAVQLVNEGLDVKFSPCGYLLAVLCYDSAITLFDSTTTAEIGSIDTKLDLDSGRKATDKVKKTTTEKNKSFTCIEFSPDSQFLIAGGQSNVFCLYSVPDRILVRRFKLTKNLSLDGVMLDVNYRKISEFGNMELFDVSDDEEGAFKKRIKLPGTAHSDLAERSAKPVMRVTDLTFNPTGRSFAVASTEGVTTYSLDVRKRFDPFQLEVAATPKMVHDFLSDGQYTKALCLALKLNKSQLIRTVIQSIPVSQVKLVVKTMELLYAEKLLKWLADESSTLSVHIHFYAHLIHELLFEYAADFKASLQRNLPSLIAVQQFLSNQQTSITKLCNNNKYTLQYVLAVRNMQASKLEDDDEQADVPLSIEPNAA